MRSQRRTTLLLLVLVPFVACAAEHDHSHSSGEAQTIHGLGTTSFATSTHSNEAQAAFMRGFLLLHLFEYPEAAKAFVEAQKLDPAFTMAYWGEAMTFNHGVWNQVDAVAANAALAKFAPNAEARAARISDPREKAYMASVELLYDGQGTKVERDLRYAKAMERLSASYPDDRNAQLFYALALLGQSESVRDVPAYLKAAAISKTIFRLEPNNPGAAHYWIHGMDDPDHAEGALEAARALSKIAPDAPHAQHMCSHIFMALGMWDDVVKANIEAIRVGDKQDHAEGFPSYGCGHYPEWLEYGYFQQGRFGEGWKMVDGCKATDAAATAWIGAHPGKLPFGAKSAARLHTRLVNTFANMRNMALIESKDWQKAATRGAFDPSILEPDSAAWWNFVTGIAEAELGNAAGASAALATMRGKVDAVRADRDADPEDVKALDVGLDELSGLIHVKSGEYEAGVAELRRASGKYRGMAFAFGPPVTVKPPEELLGEVLLEKGDSAGAREAFQQSLKRAPRRAQSLSGLSRATAHQ